MTVMALASRGPRYRFPPDVARRRGDFLINSSRTRVSSGDNFVPNARDAVMREPARVADFLRCVSSARSARL